MRGLSSIVSPSLQCTLAESCLGSSPHAGLNCANTRSDVASSVALVLAPSPRVPCVSQQVLKAGRALRYGWGRWSQLWLGQNEKQSSRGQSPLVWCRPPVYSSLAESRGSHPPPPKAVAVGTEQRMIIESAPLSSPGPIKDRATVPSQRVLLIGVGTAGGKMVRHIASGLTQSPTSRVHNMEVWAMNTDAQALRAAGTEHQLQLGVELMKGLGTGGDSTLGVCAAESSAGAIADVMDGPPGVCYVICGAGGGTGGGASPLILRAARVAGHLSVGVITLPFRFEGPRRLRQSQATMAALQKEADMVCAIDQDAFLHQQQNLSMTQAADMAASMALRATQGVTTLLQAEAAHLSGHAMSLHGALPPAGIIELLRGSGRTVVAHGTGPTPHTAIHLALQAPQLGSLDMFAGSLVCVLSSAMALSAAQVADALTQLRGCTGGNSRRVVLATCKEVGTQAVGATIILTGLPHELLDVAGPSRPVSPATRASKPTAATPSRINEAQPSKERQGFSESVPSISGSAAAPQQRDTASAPSPVPSSSIAMAAAALSHFAATHEMGPKDGARLPPAGGKIVIIPAGKDSWEEASSSANEGAAAAQQSVVFVAPAGLEPYSSPLDIPRGPDAVPSQRGRGRAASGSASSAPEEVKPRLRPVNEAGGGGGQTQAPQRRASQSKGTAVAAERAAAPSLTARGSSPSDVRAVKVATVDKKKRAVTGGAVHGRTNGDRRGEAQPQPQPQSQRGAPTGKAPPADARMKGRRLETEDAVVGASVSVSAPSGGAGKGVALRADVPGQLSRAAAANAAALAWWRQVVEEPSERLKAATEEQQQQQQHEHEQEEDCATAVTAGPGSVSSRARAILARERHEEQYRLVRVKQVLPDGSVYEGEMAGTGPHGQGQCVYLNGDVYAGGWRHGVRHGVGRLTEASGDVYDGAWRGGHRHGQGRVEYAEGHVLSARFVDGHVHGPAVIAFGHGSTFYGAFRFNRRQGVAMTVHADGKREWEVWEHGQRVS